MQKGRFASTVLFTVILYRNLLCIFNGFAVICNKLCQRMQCSFCQLLILFLLWYPFSQRRNQSKIHIHGLEVFSIIMADIPHEGPHSCFFRKCLRFHPMPLQSLMLQIPHSLLHRSSVRQRTAPDAFALPVWHSANPENRYRYFCA